MAEIAEDVELASANDGKQSQDDGAAAQPQHDADVPAEATSSPIAAALPGPPELPHRENGGDAAEPGPSVDAAEAPQATEPPSALPDAEPARAAPATDATAGEPATSPTAPPSAPSEERARDRDEDGRRRRDHDDKDRDKDRDRGRSAEYSRDRDYERRKERKERRRSRSRTRSRDRKRDRRSRSRSRDRHRSRHDRSRSRSRGEPRSSSRRSSHRSRERRSSRHRSRERRSSRRSPESGGEEYGGYKPRKRVEAAADPKPAQAPLAVFNAQNDPFWHLRQHQQLDPAEAQRLWQEQMLKSRQLVLQQQAVSAAAAQSKTQREVYVGNLAAGLVQDFNLRQAFNHYLISKFPQHAMPGLEPVVNVSMHSDGRYAFVELRNPDLATASLELSGQLQLFGQAITVGRPSGYVDPNKAAVAAAQAAQAVAMFSSGGAPVPGVVAPQTGLQFPLAPAVAAGPPAVVAAPIAAAIPIMEAGASAIPTPYLCVTGMVNAQVLSDDQEYKDVQEDLRDECGRHGAVYEVKIPRPPNPALASQLMGVGNYGKAYVQFVDTAGAAKAKEAIHGRLFAGQTVQALFITAQAYAAIIAGIV